MPTLRCEFPYTTVINVLALDYRELWVCRLMSCCYQRRLVSGDISGACALKGAFAVQFSFTLYLLHSWLHPALTASFGPSLDFLFLLSHSHENEDDQGARPLQGGQPSDSVLAQNLCTGRASANRNSTTKLAAGCQLANDGSNAANGHGSNNVANGSNGGANGSNGGNGGSTTQPQHMYMFRRPDGASTILCSHTCRRGIICQLEALAIRSIPW